MGVYVDAGTNTGNRRLISKDNYSSGQTRELFTISISNNTPAFGLYYGSTGIAATSTALTTGWHHIAGVRDAGNFIKIYIDGGRKGKCD